MSSEAYVTLATNDRYAYGALVLAQSLHQTGTTRHFVVIVTPSVSAQLRRMLADVFHQVKVVNPLDSEDPTHLALMSRPELGVTFTKLHAWNLTEYSKCVFLDADTLVVSNVDDLFTRPEISAAPDVGWPDCFNSGVFVFVPNHETFDKLLSFAKQQGSFDGGDQGLLNQFFSDWSTRDASHRLPFTYNMAASITYTYLPAFVHYGANVKIVHFLGSPVKPWDHRYDSENDEVTLHPAADPVTAGFTLPFLKQWWRIFTSKVAPIITEVSGAEPSIEGKVAAPYLAPESDFFYTPKISAVSGATSSLAQWEAGNVDYTGRDRFENIQAHIDSQIASGAPAAQPVAAAAVKTTEKTAAPAAAAKEASAAPSKK